MYVRNDFTFGNFSIIPIIRYENITLHKTDWLANSNDPDATGVDYNTIKNNFGEFTPGLSLILRDIDVAKVNWELYTGVYKGYSSPTTAIGFNDIVGETIAPVIDGDADLKPEISINEEIGTRFVHDKQMFNGQLAVFNMDISNFYSPARAQAFQTLGSVRISGVEFATNINLSKIFGLQKHEINLYGSFTYFTSLITSGTLNDNDLLTKVIHSEATKQELTDKVNETPEGFTVYLKDSLYSGNTLSVDQFNEITSVNITYGEEGVTDYSVPYVPEFIYNVGINYLYDNFGAGISLNYTAEQFTEFFNFTAESADGAIGKLPAYSTFNANASYTVPLKEYKNKITIFVAGKNLTNQIYRASRLNRSTGGIFPAGFSQINSGVSMTF